MTNRGLINIARQTFVKRITSPELIEQINPKNKKLIERFLKEKDIRCSDKTVEAYRTDANVFFVWNLLYNENKFFVDIKKIEFSDFFSFATSELKWSPARFRRVKSFLSSLSDFVERYYDEDYPNFRNIILKSIESMPNIPTREKTILSEQQVNDLLNYLSKEINRPQEACLLALAVGCGARISELLRFTTDIIDENNKVFDGMFLETTRKIKTKGRTKQGKLLHKYIIADIFLPYYKAWLPKRKEIMEKHGQDHNYIFIKRDGTPATKDNVRTWIQKWEKFLGVPFYMHALRHYIVTHLTRLGLPSDFIVEIMGWTSSEMYKIYNDLTAKDREWKELEKLRDHLRKMKNEK